MGLSFLYFSQFGYFLLDSPETESLVTASEEENDPIIGKGLRHSYQCRIPQPQFAVHLWNCTIIVIQT